MNAAENISSRPVRIEHVIVCCEEGCSSSALGYGSNETKARHMANSSAREEGWAFFKEGDEKKWRCPGCCARIQREGAQERTLLRAERRKAEAKRIREAKKEAAEKRKTRPVSEKTAKADSTLTQQTERIVAGCEFERVIIPKLRTEPRLITAADEWRRQHEISEGVRDTDELGTRIQQSRTDYSPTDAQLDAAKWLRLVRVELSPSIDDALQMAIVADLPPKEIGASFTTIRSEDARAAIGMTLVRIALKGVADYMGLKR